MNEHRREESLNRLSQQKKTQNDQIMAALLAGQTITPLDALRDFGCFRLAARIDELRQQGHCITTEFQTRNGKKYAAYRLIAPNHPLLA